MLPEQFLKIIQQVTTPILKIFQGFQLHLGRKSKILNTVLPMSLSSPYAPLLPHHCSLYSSHTNYSVSQMCRIPSHLKAFIHAIPSAFPLSSFQSLLKYHSFRETLPKAPTQFRLPYYNLFFTFPSQGLIHFAIIHLLVYFLFMVSLPFGLQSL